MNLSIHWSLGAAVALGCGIFLLLLWALARSRRLRGGITASHGGVVVSGDNSGLINTGAINSPQQPAGAPFWERSFGIVGSIASIVGLYLIFFPPGIAGK